MLAIILAIENDDDRYLAEQLYLEFNQPMFRIANAILKNKNQAEDAVSDAFEKIIHHIDKFYSLSCKKTRGLIVIYIRSICFNMLKRDKVIEFSELNEEAEHELSTEEKVINKADYQELLKIISTFEEKYRSVMRLKFLYSFSDAEIADVLGISQENVRVRLHRAKLKLKKLLEEVHKNREQYFK